MRAQSWVVAAACSLGLGAATTVGVALKFHRAVGVEWETSDVAWMGPNEGDCLVQATMSHTGFTRRSFMMQRVIEVRVHEVDYEDVGFGLHTWTAVRGDEDERPEVTYKDGSNLLVVEEAGFPFRCLRERKWEFCGGCDVSPVATEGAIPWRESAFETVPGLPIWHGLIADTAAWGSPWMAGFLLIGKVRRARRRRRGGCASCGYAMSGLAEDACCPECGAGR